VKALRREFSRAFERPNSLETLKFFNLKLSYLKSGPMFKIWTVQNIFELFKTYSIVLVHKYTLNIFVFPKVSIYSRVSTGLENPGKYLNWKEIFQDCQLESP
jgi:hypothetical protein